jgi:enterochelin esterase-like enzyme
MGGHLIKRVFFLCCEILLIACVAEAQENTQLRGRLLTQYRQLFAALESRDPAAAARHLAADYAEPQVDGQPLSRAGREALWRRWLEKRPSVGPVYVHIESLNQEGPAGAVAMTRVVIVASVRGQGGVTAPQVVDELRRDTWARSPTGWAIRRSELITPAVAGEVIPGTDEPESPRLRALAERLRAGDGNALAVFWGELAGTAPLVELLPADAEHRLVTFVWRHSDDVERVGLDGNLPYPPWGDRSLVRLPGSDVWYRSLRVPSNTRTTYMFDVFRSFNAPAGGEAKSGRPVPFIISVHDPRNPRVFNDNSVLDLRIPAPTSYTTERAGVPKGKTGRENIRSKALAEDRAVTVYTPPGFGTSGEPYPVVVLFDGAVYGGGRRTHVPTPTILDNLISERRIPPVVGVLVHARAREPELGGSAEFIQFLAEELMPLVRRRYQGAGDPAHVVIGGSSLGGAAAAYAALERPDVFGNVLSQSGAFWLPRDVRDPVRQEFIPPRTWLIDEYIERPRVPVRFWMEVSPFESPAKMLGPNRQLRDVLRAKGYVVTYREFPSGHDYLHWRDSLADGLISLLGNPRTGGQ